jgi:A/G-specific adenine glycosylase
MSEYTLEAPGPTGAGFSWLGDPAQQHWPSRLAALHHRLLGWYAREKRTLPWRGSSDPYTVLVSEIMLQQTQVDRVIPKYLQFLEKFPSLASLAAASRADVIRAWAPLGYNRRAVRLHELARRVVDQCEGRLPKEASCLRRFEGIGTYTAAAVACFAFGEQLPTLDTNVKRVLSRLFADRLADGVAGPRALQALAEEALPAGQAADWNQALMDLGATICRTRPSCHRCPVQSSCVVGSQEREFWVKPMQKAAEASASYQVEPSYRGSSRYYRGRIVDRLRALPPGESMTLEELAPEVKPDFQADQRSWLIELLQALQADGLVQVEGALESGSAGAIRVQLA